MVVVTGEASGVGKTLVGERIVSLLSGRGLRVAVVKHVHHGVDYRVKDTGRYRGAGAFRVVAVGPGEVMIIEEVSVDPLDAVVYAGRGADAVVVEGFKGLMDMFLGLGACGVYVEASGWVSVFASGSRVARLRALGAVASVVAELVSGGRCRLRLRRP